MSGVQGRRRKQLSLGLMVVALCWCPALLGAQSASPSPLPSVSPSPVPSASPLPGAGLTAVPASFPIKPYTADEFPDWLRTIRRFEIITVGAFPIAYMNANLLFDVGRYAGKLVTGSSDAGRYVPWPVAPDNKPANTSEENTVVLLGSIGLALGVAVIDLILGLGETPVTNP